MIQVAGAIERIEGADAWVRVRPRSSGCGRCEEPGGCRSVGLAYALKAPTALFRVRNDIGAVVGEYVSLRVDERGPLRAAMLGYGFSTLLLLAGAACGTFFAPNEGVDLYALVGAVVGLSVSSVLNRWLIQRRQMLGQGVELARGGACAGTQRSNQE